MRKQGKSEVISPVERVLLLAWPGSLVSFAKKFGCCATQAGRIRSSYGGRAPPSDLVESAEKLLVMLGGVEDGKKM